MGGAAWLATPDGVSAAYADWHWELAHEYEGHSVVYRLSRGTGPGRFLKLQPAGQYPSLKDEAARARWAQHHVPVPEVVGHGSEVGTDWLVTTGLGGQDGAHPEQLQNPERLARALAQGLRRFHDDAPVVGCPFDSRLDTTLAHVRRRVAAGAIDPDRDFHPEFQHLAPSEALEILEVSRPSSEDLVVCHGDYCAPNVLIEDGQAVGYIDLGEVGVADRWWDLAAATWSITWNLGPGYEDLFLSEYGAEPDPGRREYYRLMYDLVC